MAQETLQDTFASAVNSGKAEVWREMLQEKVRDPSIALDLNLCLLDAVKSPVALEDILRFKPCLSTENSEGERAIHLAAKYGLPQCLELLARAGSTVNCSSREGWPPLHLACQHNQLANVETLLKLSANRNATRTAENLAPLHIAIMQRNTSLVSLLLVNGADPNVRTGPGRGRFTAFALAIVEGDLSILDAMLSMSSLIEYACDIDGNYPLHLAVMSGDMEKCNRVLTNMTEMIPPGDGTSTRLHRGVPHHRDQMDPEKLATLMNLPDNKQRTALHLAIEVNRKDLVGLLLDAGAGTHTPCHGKLPFELAILHLQPVHQGQECEDKWFDQLELDDAVPRLLVERSVGMETMTVNGQFPIHLAVEAGLFNLALVIMDKAPHLVHHADCSGYTPLYLACRQKSRHPGKTGCVARLLEMGLSADGAADPAKHFSPLHHAVMNDDAELVSLLLKWGADVNLRSGGSSLYTPLHTAVTSRNFAMVDILLAAGADMEVLDNEGRTPLYEAVVWKIKEMVVQLLKNKANPNIFAGRFHHSPLHAIITDFAYTPVMNLELMELLVRNGANLEVRDSHGLTPLQLLVSSLACWTMMPTSVQVADHLRLSALQLLVEGGAQLCPWPQQDHGLYRRTALQVLAYSGMLPEVYYLANVGWPLESEAVSGWMNLPGSSPAQDVTHAYLLLRHANPFPLLHLCRATIRKRLNQCTTVAGSSAEILTIVDKLPVPSSMKMYLNFKDKDYSDTVESWSQFAHLLPAGALDRVSETLPPSDEMLSAGD